MKKHIFLSVLALVVGIVSASAQSFISGDMNQDGKISIGDLANVVAVVNGDLPKEMVTPIVDAKDVADINNRIFRGTWYYAEFSPSFIVTHLNTGLGWQTVRFGGDTEDAPDEVYSRVSFTSQPYTRFFVRYTYDRTQGRILFHNDTGYCGYFDMVDVTYYNLDRDSIVTFLAYDPMENITYQFRREAVDWQLGHNRSNEYIDLGLPSRTYWSTSNLGAQIPDVGSPATTDIGRVYQWGENAGNEHGNGNFTYSSYWAQAGNKKYKKYVTDAAFGNVDNKTRLELSDDAVYYVNREGNYGLSFRIPTREQYEELINYCDIAPAVIDGVDGMKFTSRLNGMSIFFPVTGLRSDGKEWFADSGFYWTSDLALNDRGQIESDQAAVFQFDKGGRVTLRNIMARPRYEGVAIRPVYKFVKQ